MIARTSKACLVLFLTIATSVAVTPAAAAAESTTATATVTVDSSSQTPPAMDATADHSSAQDTSTSTSASPPRAGKVRQAPYLLRLHLIRHGETLANVQNLVIGQSDSPLTENGLSAARLASKSGLVNGRGTADGDVRYWRKYCSHLRRAHLTARIVLGSDAGYDNEFSMQAEDGLIPDARLRELAKGAREGYDKSLTYEEALEARRSEEGGASQANSNIPALETNEEAWEKVDDWLDFVLEDVLHDYYKYRRPISSDDQSSATCTAGDEEEESTPPRVYDVFVLSHSALIRTMIHKMVDDQLPVDYAKTRAGVLHIPNLSRTVIDVRPYSRRAVEESINGNRAAVNGGGPSLKWTSTLVQLTDVSHLQ